MSTHLSNYPCANTPDAPWNAPAPGDCEYNHPVGEKCEGDVADECIRCETECCHAAFVPGHYLCCEECAIEHFMVPKDVTAYLNRVILHSMSADISLDEYLQRGEIFLSCMARIVAEQQDQRRENEEAILRFARVA